MPHTLKRLPTMTLLLLYIQMIAIIECTVDMYAEYYPCTPPVASRWIHGVPPTHSEQLVMEIENVTLPEFNANVGYDADRKYQVLLRAIDDDAMFYMYVWSFNGTIHSEQRVLCDGHNLFKHFVNELEFEWTAPRLTLHAAAESECQISIMYTTHHTVINLQSFVIEPLKPKREL